MITPTKKTRDIIRKNNGVIRAKDALHKISNPVRFGRLDGRVKLQSWRGMSKRLIKNIATSIHQRLLKQARQDQRPFNKLLQYFAMDRFLYFKSDVLMPGR